MLTIQAFIIGCSKETTQTVAKIDYWPTDGWKSATPESQGMDSSVLNRMYEGIKNTNLSENLHSVIIIRNGYIVSECYFYPYKKDYLHMLNSVTKGITSTLVGLAIEDGYINGIDEKVVDIFSDMNINNLDDRKTSITIEHLLTMTDGLDWRESTNHGGSNNSYSIMHRSDNQVQYVLDTPMREKPGKNFNYNSGGSHLLTAIVEKTAGKTALEYATERLFTPLGISEVVWWQDKQDVYYGGSRLMMKPEDLAKVGLLYLNKGQWENKQILPENWVEDATKRHVGTSKDPTGQHGYGYHWWQNSFGGYSARGFAGQYLFVLPKENMVIVFTSGLSNSLFDRPQGLVESYILPAIKSSSEIEPDKSSFDLLSKTISDFQSSPPPNPAHLPDMALKISGKTFTMDNQEEFSFEFINGNECILNWKGTDGSICNLVIGLDGVYRENVVERFYLNQTNANVAARGNWSNTNTFILDFEALEDSNSYVWEFKFNDDKLDFKRTAVQMRNTFTETSGTIKE